MKYHIIDLEDGTEVWCRHQYSIEEEIAGEMYERSHYHVRYNDSVIDHNQIFASLDAAIKHAKELAFKHDESNRLTYNTRECLYDVINEKDEILYEC